MEDIEATGQGDSPAPPAGMTELFELGWRNVLPVFGEWGVWPSRAGWDEVGAQATPLASVSFPGSIYCPLSSLLLDSVLLAQEPW